MVTNNDVAKLNKMIITEKEESAKAEYYDGGNSAQQHALFVYEAMIKNRNNSLSIDLDKILTPPAEINLIKASSLGGGLSGVAFEVVAKQGTNILKSDTITTLGGKATFKCQPTNRNDIEITITEKIKPTDDTGTYQPLNKTMKITLKYDTTTNKWKATETTDEENVLGIANATNIDITITNQYISPIKIGGDIDGFGGFDKVDQAGNPVIGAEFKAVFEQDGKKFAEKTATSDKNGKLDFEAVQPKTTSNVKVTITETKAPAGYENSNYNKTIDFEYNTKEHKWKPLTNDVHAKVEYKDKTTYVDIDNVVNKSQIDKLTLIKSDSQNSNTKLAGAIFRITLTNIESIEGYKITSDPTVIEVTADNEGKLSLTGLVIKDVTNPVIITLEERLAPIGYKKIEGTITLTITRVGTEYTIVTSADETVRASDEFRTDVIKLTPGEDGIVKGDVNKNGILDAGDALLILKNSVGKYDFDEELKKIADVTGDNRVNSADAQWVLSHKTSVPNSGSAIGLGGKGDVNGDGKITEADAEKILKYSVRLITEIDLEKADVDGNGVVNSADALRILRYLAGEKEGSTGNVTENNHKIEVKMNDIPIMNLGGIVWAEKIKTGKEQPNINNTYSESDDEALGGVTVRLLDRDDKVVATTKTAEQDGEKVTYINNKGQEVTVELRQGQYLFTKLDDGTNYIPVGTDYKVEIDYDGITYNALMNKDKNILYNKNAYSKITSEDDHGLADDTKTIFGTENENQSKTNGGYTINYKLQDEENIPDKAIYSNVEKDGNQAFVTARSEKYLQKIEDWKSTWKDNNGVGEINLDSYAFDINFGLYKKFFDLNLGTDVDSAEVEINGQKTEYTYDQILNGMLDKDLKEKLYKTTDDKVDYNLYLAYSDYYYRIDDYKVPGSPDSLGQPYGEALPDKKDKNTELQVYVTYTLQINNQSTQHNATGVKVKYSYDEGYEYVGDVSLDKNENNVLEISGIDVAPGESKEIALKFKVKKKEDGTFVKAPSDESKYTNVAEIVEYSTGVGRLVDADSAPGNTFLGENKPTTRREDDTDTANGIVIRFKDNAERSISGKVFEDSDKNSTQNGEEQAVNDVIVQLIELVNINNKQYEYIWQETVAGSDTVKTTATSGGRGDTYAVSNSDGEYKFTQGIIPGNYMVRFIYGDGSTYSITKYTLKYNGEDYKSTYAKYDYNAEWYNNAKIGEDYLYETNNISNAVDNEARRLKVMSYAVDVDGNKGKTLNALDNITDTNKQNEIRAAYEELTGESANFEAVRKKVLENTWMCAETLKIKMPVDTDVKENTSETTEVGNGSSPDASKTQFDKVNLGLMERPKTKLVLEKHITGLTIKPVESGVRLIADARADIKNILNNVTEGQITLEGEQTGLLAIKSTRSNRGYWYLQTDTTELAQGADAYITYTYVITNKGDEDYLSEDLVNAYLNNSKTIEETTTYTYKDYLKYLENTVKEQIKLGSFTKGTYLSNFYYTGNTDGAKEVLASVESMQEDLNPKVTYVDGDNMTKNSVTIDKSYYNSNGELITGGEIGKIKETITSGSTNKLKIIKANPSTGKLVYNTDNTDWSKKAVVSKALSASEIETGGVYDSYLAEITHYTNAAGRRDQSTPANLSYVHSEDKNMNMESYKDSNENMITAETTITVAGSTITEETNYYLYRATVEAEGVKVSSSDIKLEKDKLTYVGTTFSDLTNTTFEKLNENDEFWAETFRITKPTGEDKLTPVQIAIITISAVAVLGVGIILIKKFVLKK